MAIYRLVVTRIEDNPKYDADRAGEWAKRGGPSYYGHELPPPAKLETGVLDVVVGDDDWVTIRSAVVGGWK